MPDLDFCKFHGFGNDYVVVEREKLESIPDLSALAAGMCDRHRGIGSDGLAVVSRSENKTADFHCRIFNPDGSEAGFSGNGTRCAVAYLYYSGVWQDPELRLSTSSGPKRFTFLDREGNTFGFRSRLGKPKFEASRIPFTKQGFDPEDTVEGLSVRIGVRDYEINCVNVGNPVCAVFVNNFDFNWRRIGQRLESHELFPERTNVVFAKVKSQNEIQIRIWERGAGETSSSGTCSMGAAVAAAHTGRSSREVDVIAPGGATRVEWGSDGVVSIEGTAELAFCGRFPFEQE